MDNLAIRVVLNQLGGDIISFITAQDDEMRAMRVWLLVDNQASSDRRQDRAMCNRGCGKADDSQDTEQSKE